MEKSVAYKKKAATAAPNAKSEKPWTEAAPVYVGGEVGTTGDEVFLGGTG